MDVATGNDISEPKQKSEAELTDLEMNGRVEQLINDIQLAQEKLQNSSFYEEFTKQMMDPEMVSRLLWAISADPRYSKLQLVIYGLGGLECSERRRLEYRHMQFAFALLLRDTFEWVDDIEVYDPVLSAVDRMAINAFNCTCLTVNEDCKRTVDRPTLFFMPRCPFFLYDNVLAANWTPENLRKIIIIGNTFEGTVEDSTFDCTSKIKIALMGRVLREIPLPINRRRSLDPDRLYIQAFNRISWHFIVVKRRATPANHE